MAHGRSLPHVCKNLLIVLSERVRSDNEYIATASASCAKRAQRTDRRIDGSYGNRHWMRTMFEREVTRGAAFEQGVCA